MATYSLGKIAHDPNEWDTVKVDFQKARDFVLDNPPEALPKNHVELINSKERLLAWLQIMAEPFIKERACDLETYGVNFFRDDPSSMSFTVEIDGEMHSIAFLTKPKPEHPGWWAADLDDPEFTRRFRKYWIILLRFIVVCLMFSFFGSDVSMSILVLTRWTNT